MPSPSRPTQLPLAITMGDPAGVGPEILVRAWREPALQSSGPRIVFGDPSVLLEAADRFAPGIDVVEFADVPSMNGEYEPSSLRCVRTSASPGQPYPHGIVTADTGRAAHAAIVRATQSVLAGECRGLVTLPISKFALHQAGYRLPGHTELLAELCGVRESSMMLYVPTSKHRGGFGVVHVTLHMSLRQALDAITIDTIMSSCLRLRELMQKFLRHSGIDLEPKLAICAVNPHAGEEGLFGTEEIAIVSPAVENLRQRGLDVVGPLPADTLFAKGTAGAYDGIVAMYHDQGHIAVKLLTMFEAVNITLGLPIVRTSVAHGTALDIAWTGQARIGGLLAATEACSILADCR